MASFNVRGDVSVHDGRARPVPAPEPVETESEAHSPQRPKLKAIVQAARSAPYPAPLHGMAVGVMLGNISGNLDLQPRHGEARHIAFTRTHYGEAKEGNLVWWMEDLDVFMPPDVSLDGLTRITPQRVRRF